MRHLRNSNLVYICADVNPFNSDGESVFGYFDGVPTKTDLEEIRANCEQWAEVSIVSCLSWVVCEPVEYPNALSEMTGLRRFLIGELG